MMMRRVLTVFTLCFGLTMNAVAQQSPDEPVEKPRKKSKKNKKDEEPVTQVLPLPKDLPLAITAETERLSFFISPLTTKGLLSAQTRESLRYLAAASKSATIVKLRAFVAGSGDTRRIQTLVSEVMTEKKLPLPALTTIQVGSLGMEGAQVLFEAIAVDRRTVNPQGLAFISGQVGKTLREAVDGVNKAVSAAGAGETLTMTCFVSSLEDAAADRTGITMPASAVVVQMRREPSPTAAECEAIARLRSAPAEPVVLLNPDGLTKSANYSQIALVKAPKLVFTGLQIAFHDQESDVKLAFDRLARTLETETVKYSNVFYTHTYALTARAMDQVRAVRFNYLDKTRPPASTLLPFEGLPALDASFGIEVVAAAR
jgi:enamine deaminase RidA (YjgF/YER057c/UK114 family)